MRQPVILRKDAHTQGRDVTINSKGQVHNQHFDTTEYGTRRYDLRHEIIQTRLYV